MDTVYEAARKRHDVLSAELKELETFLDLYRATRQRLGLDAVARERTGAADANHQLPLEPVSEDQSLPSSLGNTVDAIGRRLRVTDNPSPAVVAEAVVGILLRHGRPLTRRELHGLLMEQDIVVKGVDPVKTLGTMLWRSDRFIQAEYQGHEGYWPKWQALPNGHTPPQTP